jgi:hypothetical protein
VSSNVRRPNLIQRRSGLPTRLLTLEVYLKREARRERSTDENCSHEPSIVAGMARYTLVYGVRLVPEGTLVRADDARLHLKGGDTTGVTLHTIDGTIPQLRRALDRSLDAFFDLLPGATEEDKQAFED